ncbi:MAG TPA: type II toxin-antitoxin system Phd/YefM family antitoxin [Stellaceae bacterium]|nr:type II toxin-antitoxin system Phd/YefM family antitoxin [Stellaceae bacterium]
MIAGPGDLLSIQITGQENDPMDRHEWSLQDAKNSFSAVVAAACRGTPQTVTKHGKPAVVILSAAEYERLSRKRSPAKCSFIDHLLAMPKDDGEFERIEIEPRDVEF